MDDTLWWFTENSKVALEQAFHDFGGDYWPCDYDTFHKVYLKHNNELWDLYHHGLIERDVLKAERFRRTLTELGCDSECGDLASRMDEHYLLVLAQQTKLLPGARHLLEYLNAKGYDVNVLSNGFKGIQQQKLVSGGIDHLIHHVVLSDDCGITKPLPGIYDYAMQVCNTTPEASLMIGDNPETDIQGAHQAGWRTIYFNLRGIDPIEGTADATVTTLEQIEDLL
ncbi:MAG: YjjG family noncanonical pyrimidine nucleotidase [Muribaculaceae bacterium]|nr:YjjG family noncanonical pyrimidine nucleotidase [Muribaculaceae bacterium]